MRPDVQVLVFHSFLLASLHFGNIRKLKQMLGQYSNIHSSCRTLRQKGRIQCIMRKERTDLLKNDFYCARLVHGVSCAFLALKNLQMFSTLLCGIVSGMKCFTFHDLDITEWTYSKHFPLNILFSPMGIFARIPVHVLQISINISIVNRIKTHIQWMC